MVLVRDMSIVAESLRGAGRDTDSTFRVYTALARQVRVRARDITRAVEDIGEGSLRLKPMTDLADDCLFTCTFFRNHVKLRAARTGAPGVQWYIAIGEGAFERTGYPQVAADFRFWCHYIREQFPH